MERLITILLLAVAIINIGPLIGVFSADRLAALYGIAPPAGDLLILMRHRAVLLAIVGGLLVAAAFHRPLERAAVSAGLVSMLSFLGIVFLVGDVGAEVRKVAWVDAFASVALVAALVLRRLT